MSNIAVHGLRVVFFAGSQPQGLAPDQWVPMTYPNGTTVEDVLLAAATLVNAGQVRRAQVVRWDDVNNPLDELGWQRYGA